MGRYVCAILLAAGLTGCATTRPAPPIPIPEIVYVDCLPDELPSRPIWLFDQTVIGGLNQVKELGGTNRDLYYVAVRDAEAGRTANTRLGMAEEYVLRLEELILAGCDDAR